MESTTPQQSFFVSHHFGSTMAPESTVGLTKLSTDPNNQAYNIADAQQEVSQRQAQYGPPQSYPGVTKSKIDPYNIVYNSALAQQAKYREYVNRNIVLDIVQPPCSAVSQDDEFALKLASKTGNTEIVRTVLPLASPSDAPHPAASDDN